MTFEIIGPDGETYTNYLRRVWSNSYLRAGEWRLGQTLYNCAPDHIRIAVAQSDVDPFHDDSVVPKFLTWARESWHSITHLFFAGDFTSLCGAESPVRNHTISETTCFLCIAEYSAMILEDMAKETT